MTNLQTIAEAFAAWNQIEALRQEVDDDTCNRLSSEMSRIEHAAVQLPVTCTLDAWRLLTMTTNEDGDVMVAGDVLFRRARAETAPKAGDTLETVFAAWLAVEARIDGTDDATFARLAEDMKRLEQVADALPVDDPLDVWRKVVMSLVWCDYAHPAAGLLREARAALGIKAPTQH